MGTVVTHCIWTVVTAISEGYYSRNETGYVADSEEDTTGTVVVLYKVRQPDAVVKGAQRVIFAPIRLNCGVRGSSCLAYGLLTIGNCIS